MQNEGLWSYCFNRSVINGSFLHRMLLMIEVRYSCILTPELLNIYTENVMRNIKNDENYDKFDSFNIAGMSIFKSDLQMTVFFSNSPKRVQQLMLAVKKYVDDKTLYLKL